MNSDTTDSTDTTDIESTGAQTHVDPVAAEGAIMAYMSSSPEYRTEAQIVEATGIHHAEVQLYLMALVQRGELESLSIVCGKRRQRFVRVAPEPPSAPLRAVA